MQANFPSLGKICAALAHKNGKKLLENLCKLMKDFRHMFTDCNFEVIKDEYVLYLGS